MFTIAAIENPKIQEPDEVLDSYFLEARCQLLEIAAMLDRYDRAVSRASVGNGTGNGRINWLYESLAMLSETRG